MNKEVLLSRLRALHRAAMQGDARATWLVKHAKERAARGDKKAQLVFNTLRVLHWQERGPFDKAEAFYARLRAGDADAMRRARLIVEMAKRGSADHLRAFRMLRAIHHKNQISVWAPGAPRVGFYGMPTVHRPGIEVPVMAIGALPLTRDAVTNLLNLLDRALATQSYAPDAMSRVHVPEDQGGGGFALRSTLRSGPPTIQTLAAAAPRMNLSSATMSRLANLRLPNVR